MRQKIAEQFRRWLQRVPGPEPQPIRLPQRRVYVLPSSAGLAMLITIIVMLVASINYNLSLGYALSFVLASAGVAHVLHSWRALVGLTLITRPPEGECFAGETASFTLHASHTNRRERPAISVKNAAGQSLVCFDLAPAAGLEMNLPIASESRGWLWSGRLTIECRAPLGWVRAWSYIEPDARTLIYPHPAGQSQPEHSAASGETSQATQAGQDDFQGLRNYQANDTPSRIAWKSLARGTLLAKHYAGGMSPHWSLDFSSLPSTLDNEERLSQLTQWVLNARQLGASTELRLPGQQLGPADSPAHHAACLRALALFGQASS